MNNNMKTSDFDYYLPEELIAQHPEDKRDHSRLMVINREDNTIEDKNFYDIIDYLNPNDLLVVNNTKVIPARLFGHKEKTGGKVELLLLKKIEKDTWECLVKPGRRIHVGDELTFGDDLNATVVGRGEGGIRNIEFHYNGIFEEILSQLGEMPLPPYIHEKLEDKDRYQTVYAKYNGSAAAPTAGLHFTEELLEKIKDKSIEIAPVTLHVGLGTFRPVSEENILDHEMHSEFYTIPEETAQKIKKTRENGGRIIAVGTTSIRALESAADENGNIEAKSEDTNIFIYPGVDFKVVDAVITNFHLPKSTLLMLVSAFYNREDILNAYKHAVENKYRFFSFGDAMFIQ